jgi:hypothetical protein
VATVAVKMFSHLIYFLKKLYKCCTCSAILEDNAAVVCIVGRRKKV